MKSYEIEGKTYVLKSDADEAITGFKEDMHKYKDDKKDLKSQVKDLESKNEDLTIDLKTSGEQLDSVGASEEDQKKAKMEVADLKGKLSKSQAANDKLNGELKDSTKNFRDLSLETNLRSKLAEKIHPKFLDKAARLAKLDANFSDDGTLTMGDQGVDVSTYVTNFAESSPEWTMDESVKKGSGMNSQNGSNGASKSLRDMTKQEKNDLIKNNPKQYTAMVEAEWGKQTAKPSE